jgi:hypothetical protein
MDYVNSPTETLIDELQLTLISMKTAKEEFGHRSYKVIQSHKENICNELKNRAYDAKALEVFDVA